MKWLRRLSHRFWLWLGEKIEQHRVLGKPGFEAIYYKGKPIERDLDGFTADHMWSVPVDEDVKSSVPMTFTDRITRVLNHLSNEEAAELTNSRVLKDRILNQDKWEEPVIKKGYDKH